jgi:hypothetical protein
MLNEKIWIIIEFKLESTNFKCRKSKVLAEHTNRVINIIFKNTLTNIKYLL